MIYDQQAPQTYQRLPLGNCCILLGPPCLAPIAVAHNAHTVVVVQATASSIFSCCAFVACVYAYDPQPLSLVPTLAQQWPCLSGALTIWPKTATAQSS